MHGCKDVVAHQLLFGHVFFETHCEIGIMYYFQYPLLLRVLDGTSPSSRGYYFQTFSCFSLFSTISANGKLVVWGPVVRDFRDPIMKGIVT